MKRFKALGLTALLALALSAFAGVSTASASWSEFANEDWAGESPGTSMSFESLTLNCANSTFLGKTDNAHGLRVSPALSGCAYFGIATSWSMGSCKYEFHLGEGGAHTSTVDIVDCGSSFMTWRVVILGAPCEVKIGNQTGIKVAEDSYGGTGESREMSLSTKLTGIKYTETGSWCPGETGTFTNGTFTGDWNVHLERFRTETSSASLGGKLLEKMKIEAAGNTLTCPEGSYTGSVSSKKSESLTLNPTYKNCTFFVATTVEMNGCAYTIDVHGTFALTGSKCASEPMSYNSKFLGSECKVTIGPQTLGTLSYTNVGSGKERSITLDPTATGITYTSTGFLCGKAGTFSDGVLKGKSSLTSSQGIWLG